MRKDSKDKTSWLLSSFAHIAVMGWILKGEVCMEKLEYTQPEIELIEMEVEDIMTESGWWTDPV